MVGGVPGGQTWAWHGPQLSAERRDAGERKIVQYGELTSNKYENEISLYPLLGPYSITILRYSIFSESTRGYHGNF